MPNSPNSAPAIANVYIDGYNFYYSISKPGQLGLLKHGWCDFSILAKRLVRQAFPGAKIGAVKYYTARVPRYLQLKSGELERQQLWLDALKEGAKGDIHIIEGYHARDNVKPRVEKQSDINLAIGMVRDSLMPATAAMDSTFDTRGSNCRDPFSQCDRVILISADKDFLPAAQMIAAYGRPVAIFLPLGNELPSAASGHENIRHFQILDEDLVSSRLPDRIERKNGGAITWNRYLQLKTSSQRVRTGVEPPDQEFDRRCWEHCRMEAIKSVDNDTQVGCIVVSPERDVLVTGHNTLPNGIAAHPPNRVARPDKYVWLEHAERNALYSAARLGIPLEGCTLYVELTPCVDCARGIIQSGILEVVISKERMRAYSNPEYREQQIQAASLLKESGVVVRFA